MLVPLHARAAVTKYRRPRGVNHRRDCLTALQAGRLSRVLVGLGPAEAGREDLFLPLSRAIDCCFLPVSLRHLLSVCVRISP